MSERGLAEDDFAFSWYDEGGELLDNTFLRRLDGLDLISRKILQGKLKGERRSKKRGHSVEFADFRQYSHGDDLRFLDWNIYGRLDRLFIKMFLEEEDLFVYILVDGSTSMDYGSPNKFRYAMKLAAALGYIGLVNYSRVGIGVFNDGLASTLEPVRGRRNVHKMVRFLKDQKPGGDTDLNKARLFALKHRQKGLVILISDFLDRGGYEAGIRALLARKCDLFCLHVLSEQELNPPLKGDLKLLDVEAGEETEVTISGPLLASYQSVLSNFMGGLKDYCVKRGVSYLKTSTAMPFEQLILGYLRQRGLVR